jgi:hypothetical protein
MQHHGIPTRLLDWSESVLIALYFAVIEDETEDGEMWVMQPAALNVVSCRQPSIVTRSHPGVEKLAQQAKNWEANWPSLHVTIAECPPYPISVYPPLRYRRQTNQLSAFTIHPVPNGKNGIEDMLDHPVLIRYLIRANFKEKIRTALAFLGITQRFLFPDLGGLCRSLVDDEKRRKTTGTISPNPPRCGGEV